MTHIFVNHMNGDSQKVLSMQAVTTWLHIDGLLLWLLESLMQTNVLVAICPIG